MNGLLEALVGTSMEVLCPKLESKYLPWTYTFSESAFKKWNSIYCTLSWYTLHRGSTFPIVPDKIAPCSTVVERVASQSRTHESRNHANTNALARQKRNANAST